MNLPPLNEVNSPPGTPLRPYSTAYGEEQIREFLSRTGEAPELYAVEGVLHVPPGMLLGAYGRLIHESFHYQAGVHVSSQMEFSRTPIAGELLQVTGEIVRLFERNGDKYVTFSVNLANEKGERLARIEHTSVYQLRPRTAASSTE